MMDKDILHAIHRNIVSCGIGSGLIFVVIATNEGSIIREICRMLVIFYFFNIAAQKTNELMSYLLPKTINHDISEKILKKFFYETLIRNFIYGIILMTTAEITRLNINFLIILIVIVILLEMKYSKDLYVNLKLANLKE